METEGTRLYTGTCRNRMGVGSHYLADRGYDTDAILERALQAPIHRVIPPTSKIETYNRDWHTLRHLVENAFLYLKRWRGLATHGVKKPWPHSLRRFRCNPFLSGPVSRDDIV